MLISLIVTPESSLFLIHPNTMGINRPVISSNAVITSPCESQPRTRARQLPNDMKQKYYRHYKSLYNPKHYDPSKDLPRLLLPVHCSRLTRTQTAFSPFVFVCVFSVTAGGDSTSPSSSASPATAAFAHAFVGAKALFALIFAP